MLLVATSLRMRSIPWSAYVLYLDSWGTVSLVIFADSLVNKNLDECERVPISKSVTDGLLRRHKQLVKIVSAASIDPKRA